jgi:hypothetical protein
MSSKTATRPDTPNVLHLPRGRPLECRKPGRGVRGRDRRVPRRGPGPEARVPTPIVGDAHAPEVVEAYYLQRTRFERIAERKLRRRQLTEDGECGDQREGLALGGKSRRSRCSTCASSRNVEPPSRRGLLQSHPDYFCSWLFLLASTEWKSAIFDLSAAWADCDLPFT